MANPKLDAMTLTQLHTKILDASHKTLGAIGESMAILRLRSAGYHVTMPGRYHQGDLHVVDTGTGKVSRVEVKTARRAIDKRWHFTLYKQSKDGQTDHKLSDFVILIALSERPVYFIVPTAILKGQHQVTITSKPETYSGRLAKYRMSGALRLS